MIDSGTLTTIAFVCAGVLWVYHIAARWRSDVEEFRTATESATRIVIAGYWVLAAVILLALILFLIGLIQKFGLL